MLTLKDFKTALNSESFVGEIAIACCQSVEELEEVRRDFLAVDGRLKRCARGIKQLHETDRPQARKIMAEARDIVSSAFDRKHHVLTEAANSGQSKPPLDS